MFTHTQSYIYIYIEREREREREKERESLKLIFWAKYNMLSDEKSKMYIALFRSMA